MYLLDTNVLSEIMRPQPEKAVADWLSRCPIPSICTATICQAEIFYGIERLPQGARRHALMLAADQLFGERLGERVLPFDPAAARAFALIKAERERAGRPILTEDAMVAAIARIHSVSVVTRDEGGFAGCGVPLINPWVG